MIYLCHQPEHAVRSRMNRLCMFMGEIWVSLFKIVICISLMPCVYIVSLLFRIKNKIQAYNNLKQDRPPSWDLCQSWLGGVGRCVYKDDWALSFLSTLLRVYAVFHQCKRGQLNLCRLLYCLIFDQKIKWYKTIVHFIFHKLFFPFKPKNLICIYWFPIYNLSWVTLSCWAWLGFIIMYLILKQELIQNADDALATEVIFIHDERSYGAESLWNANLGQYQGIYVDL